MDHPTLRSGITDQMTTLVAAAATSWEPEETRRMLNPSYTDIEVLAGGTQLSPHLKISIVRFGTPRLPGTMRDLKFAVELLEDLMQTPLPSPHIILVFNDLAVSKGAGAQNQSFALSSHVDNEQPVMYASGMPMLHSFSVHEIAHHYFDGNHMEYWLSEAGPTIFEYVYRLGDKDPREVPPRMLQVNPRGECEAHDLKTLEELDLHQPDDPVQFRCNHYLGFQFFRELLETMGREAFFAGIRDLYHLSLATQHSGGRSGIAEVRKAFSNQSEIVEKHWSGKLNAPENRRWDEDIVHSSHDLVQWDQHPTYDGDSITFSGTLLGDAVLSGGTIAEARRDGYQNFHLYPVSTLQFGGNILPPGWTGGTRHPADNIDNALRLRLRELGDSSLERFFSDEAEERFFVKNIERVQGDERDVVILSVGYHRVADGSLPYRFGPLNQEGGERRLNVAITRQRQEMHLVSSFSHHDMEPGKSSARGVELLRQYLEFAASGGLELGATVSDVPLNGFELDVMHRLTGAGMPVTPQYGVGSYRLDFACGHPDQPGRMVLAVEADGVSYHSGHTSRERDRLRQEILEAKGWRFHRIWSTSWFRNRDEEVARAVKAWREACSSVDSGAGSVGVGAGVGEAGPGYGGMVEEAMAGLVARVQPAKSAVKPWVMPGNPITAYSHQDLVALARWVMSDTLLRTDDELHREMRGELGFRKGGSRINPALQRAIDEAKASGDSGVSR